MDRLFVRKLVAECGGPGQESLKIPRSILDNNIQAFCEHGRDAASSVRCHASKQLSNGDNCVLLSLTPRIVEGRTCRMDKQEGVPRQGEMLLVPVVTSWMLQL